MQLLLVCPLQTFFRPSLPQINHTSLSAYAVTLAPHGYLPNDLSMLTERQKEAFDERRFPLLKRDRQPSLHPEVKGHREKFSFLRRSILSPPETPSADFFLDRCLGFFVMIFCGYSLTFLLRSCSSPCLVVADMVVPLPTSVFLLVTSVLGLTSRHDVLSCSLLYEPFFGCSFLVPPLRLRSALR